MVLFRRGQISSIRAPSGSGWVDHPCVRNMVTGRLRDKSAVEPITGELDCPDPGRRIALHSGTGILKFPGGAATQKGRSILWMERPRIL